MQLPGKDSDHEGGGITSDVNWFSFLTILVFDNVDIWWKRQKQTAADLNFDILWLKHHVWQAFHDVRSGDYNIFYPVLRELSFQEIFAVSMSLFGNKY